MNVYFSPHFISLTAYACLEFFLILSWTKLTMSGLMGALKTAGKWIPAPSTTSFLALYTETTGRDAIVMASVQMELHNFWKSFESRKTKITEKKENNDNHVTVLQEIIPVHDWKLTSITLRDPALGEHHIYVYSRNKSNNHITVFWFESPRARSKTLQEWFWTKFSFTIYLVPRCTHENRVSSCDSESKRRQYSR